jgi:hypothetical protein
MRLTVTDTGAQFNTPPRHILHLSCSRWMHARPLVQRWSSGGRNSQLGLRSLCQKLKVSAHGIPGIPHLHFLLIPSCYQQGWRRRPPGTDPLRRELRDAVVSLDPVRKRHDGHQVRRAHSASASGFEVRERSQVELLLPAYCRALMALPI